MKNFNRITGITLISLVFLSLFVFMIHESGWIAFLKTIGITFIIVVTITGGVLLATSDKEDNK